MDFSLSQGKRQEFVDNFSSSKKDFILAIIAICYGAFLCLLLIDHLVIDIKSIWAFTNWTNIVSSIWLILYGVSILIKNEKINNVCCNKNVLISILMMCLLTFFVVLFWLAPFWKGKWLSGGINGLLFYLHFLTPVIITFYFFIIKLKGKWNWKTNFYACFFPLFWVIVIYIRLAIIRDGWVVYDFVDYKFYEKITGNFTVGILMMIIILLIIANIFYWSALGIGKLQNKLNR